jgi:hypothetical protein
LFQLAKTLHHRKKSHTIETTQQNVSKLTGIKEMNVLHASDWGKADSAKKNASR